jgi:hypothetical protein
LEPYSRLRKYVTNSRFDIPGNVFLGVDALAHNGQHPSDRIMEVVRLYCCWFESSRTPFAYARFGEDWGFVESELPKDSLQKMFDHLSKDQGKVDARAFGQFLRDVLGPNPTPLAQKSNESKDKKDAASPEIDSYSDRDKQISQDTPHKKRKRVIEESQTGRDKRDRALKLSKHHEDRARMLLQTQSSELVETANGIIVNVGKQEDQGLICLNSHIGEKIKPHQTEGLRFMWREVVESSVDQKTEDMQGCLLAHTMGLGKTMQA